MPNCCTIVSRLTPRVRRVSARTFPLNRTTVDGASRRREPGGRVKENPRNVRSPGRATALFAPLTVSLSVCVMKRGSDTCHDIVDRFYCHDIVDKRSLTIE